MKPNLSDIDETRYGSLFKLLRVIDLALRFIGRLKKQGELRIGRITDSARITESKIIVGTPHTTKALHM